MLEPLQDTDNLPPIDTVRHAIDLRQRVHDYKALMEKYMEHHALIWPFIEDFEELTSSLTCIIEAHSCMQTLRSRGYDVPDINVNLFELVFTFHRRIMGLECKMHKLIRRVK